MKYKYVIYFFVLLFCSYHAFSNSLVKIGGLNEDYGRDIVIDLEGSSIMTGYFNGTVNFNPDGQAKNFISKGKSDIYLVKYNNEGQFVWGFSIGASGDDAPNRVFSDFLGNYYIAGYFSGTVDFDPSTKIASRTSKGGKDVFVAKYNYDGDFQWVVSFGGPMDDEATDVSIDLLANVHITGFFTGKIDMDASDGEDSDDTFTSMNQNYDIFVGIYNELGDYNLGFILGGTGNDRGTGVKANINGDIIVAGNFENTVDFDLTGNSYNLSSSGLTDFFIASYDYLNELNFAFRFGGSGADLLGYGAIELDKQDNILIAGKFSGTVNFNPNGMAQLISKGRGDGFLAKYSSSGTYLWAFTIGSAGEDAVLRLSLGLTNNIAICGYFSGRTDFDPSQTGVYDITPKSTGNSSDGFVAFYSADGTFIWANGHGTSGSLTYLSTASGVSISNLDEIQSTGVFFGKSEFYTKNETKNLISSGSSDIFLVKYDKSGSFKNSIAPNPFLKLLSPNGGERWKIGDKHKIQWMASNIDKIKIEYSTNGGTNWIEIANNITASDTNYQWIIPATPSANCLVKISHPSNPLVFDVSDELFEIYQIPPPKLTIIQPNGGENLKANTSFEIKWSFSGENHKIKIYFSSDDGNSWTAISNEIDATVLNYNWTVPDMNSENCKIRIKDAETNGNVIDVQSQTKFKISTELSIKDSYFSDMIKILYERNLEAIIVQSKENDLELKTINLFDINGNLVANYNVDALLNQYIIPVNQMSSGIYLIGLNLSDRVEVKKISLIK